jgi:two-component system cell cycle response regulator DivK
MAGEQILIVEDNEKNMKLFRDVLHATGYRTLEAPTAGQALTLAMNHRPALVLMDIRLPDMSGVEALRLLRVDERTADIPVVAVTAQAMEGDRARFIEAGFDGYVSKPVDIDAFLATVEQQCRPNPQIRR